MRLGVEGKREKRLTIKLGKMRRKKGTVLVEFERMVIKCPHRSS
jgi:hypothetical protein